MLFLKIGNCCPYWKFVKVFLTVLIRHLTYPIQALLWPELKISETDILTWMKQLMSRYKHMKTEQNEQNQGMVIYSLAEKEPISEIQQKCQQTPRFAWGNEWFYCDQTMELLIAAS